MKSVSVLAACLVLVAIGLGACTTAQEIKRPDGSSEYVIACGAGTGWNVCYKRANKVCPRGYNTLSKDPGFNRKELRISCPHQTSK